MTLETLIKSTCDEWSAAAEVPIGLADRALRRRNRRRSFRVAFAAGSTALLIGAAAVAVSVNDSSQRLPKPPVDRVQLSTDTSLRTDLNSKFPRHLVAAGHIAVAAYYTVKQVPAKNPQTVKYTWYLYQPTSDTYAKTSWADLDVAPGMHQAAVLEGPLPTTRVGILDMATQKVTRWISVDHPVGDVAWAPDGRRLLLTGYPARSNKITDPSSSTGFYVMDARADPGTFHPVPMDPDNPSTRADFHWNRTGALLWEDSHTLPRRFFDLRGNQVPAPKLEAEAHEEAGLSPNGTLMPSFGPGPGPNITITNVETGKTVANLPVEQARAWADDEHLIALACNPDACTGKGEFRNRLVLAGLDGKITPLTRYRDSQAPDAWEPIFTHR